MGHRLIAGGACPFNVKLTMPSDTVWFHASAESVKCLPVASAAALDQRLDKAIPDLSAAPSTLLVIPAATIEVAQHGTMGAVGQGPASCPTN